MREYSDEVAQEIEDKVSSWADEFQKSEEYLGLSAGERRQSRFVTGVFADLMYGYHLERPEDWSTGSLWDCCLILLPEKVLAGPEFYEAVEPVLTAFFAFLGREGHIKNPKELTNELKGIAGRMVEKSRKSENWGMAKTLFAQALEDGVDLEDDEEMQDFFDKLNEEM